MTALRLGLADLAHEWPIAVCQVLALAAVLAPLLVLYGLKHGIVTGMLECLREDPANREIRVVGNLGLGRDEVARIAGLPGVGYLLPLPRSIARTLYFSALRDGGGNLVDARLLPSAEADPLRAAGAPTLGEDEVALTPQLARRLGVAPGDLVEGGNVRTLEGGRRERLALRLEVREVLGEGRLGGAAALVHPHRLDQIEAFLDGFALPELGFAIGRPLAERPERYEGLRLYAATLADVEALTAALQAPPWRLDVRSEAGRVRAIRELDANLARVFQLIVLVGGGGYLVSLGASLWANVARKRRELSIYRLLGASRAALMALPVSQAMALATAGAATALLLYAPVAAVINRRFADAACGGGAVCTLRPIHIVVAVVATVAAAALAALVGGARAAGVEPSEGMRDA
jgi:putative ABC transport system permease protein